MQAITPNDLMSIDLAIFFLPFKIVTFLHFRTNTINFHQSPCKILPYQKILFDSQACAEMDA